MTHGSVVDTNVLVVANEESEQAGSDCVVACVRELQDISSRGLIVIDDGYRVLREYRRVINSSRPGVGAEFLIWIYRNQANTEVCEQVAVTQTSDDPEEFDEFRMSPKLKGFDPADRKFVAVAMASENDPVILNATDNDWWEYRETLEDAGVQIRFLCPELMRETW